jgi:hypothetical protein
MSRVNDFRVGLNEAQFSYLERSNSCRPVPFVIFACCALRENVLLSSKYGRYWTPLFVSLVSSLSPHSCFTTY